MCLISWNFKDCVWHHHTLICPRWNIIYYYPTKFGSIRPSWNKVFVFDNLQSMNMVNLVKRFYLEWINRKLWSVKPIGITIYFGLKFKFRIRLGCAFSFRVLEYPNSNKVDKLLYGYVLFTGHYFEANKLLFLLVYVEWQENISFVIDLVIKPTMCSLRQY